METICMKFQILFWNFMQIVSNWHEISNPVFWEKLENIINLSSADLAQRVVKVKGKGYTLGEVWLFELGF